MRILIVLLFLVVSLTSAGQTIIKNEVIDTGSNVIETSWETLNNTISTITYFRFRKVDSTIYMEIKALYYIGPFTVKENNKLIFLLSNGNYATLYNTEYRRSKIGDCDLAVGGKNKMGINLIYRIKNEDIEELMKYRILRFKIVTSIGFIEEARLEHKVFSNAIALVINN